MNIEIEKNLRGEREVFAFVFVFVDEEKFDSTANWIMKEFEQCVEGIVR